jgi:hypothetical protein
MMFLRCLLLMCVSMPVWAYARVVVTTSEPVQLFVDGMLIPTSVGNIRSAIPHVNPGKHTVAIHDLKGNHLHSESVDVPADADVRVQWNRGGVFVVTGNTGPPVAPDGSTPPVSGSAVGLDTPSGVASGSPAHLQPTPNGSLGTHSGPRASDIVRGNGVSTNRVGVIERAAQGASPASIVTGVAISGVQSLAYGAKSGTNFGPDTAVRQKIVKPNVVYGQVIFRKTGGEGMRVYADGMLVAQLSAGAADFKARVEVGRRTLEFRSVIDNRGLYTGDLQVDRSHTVQLALSENSQPRPIVRPWLWKSL